MRVGRLAKGLALLQSGAFVFLACRHDRPARVTPTLPPAVIDEADAGAPEAPASTRVRLCTFRGHHGYPGITVALEESCGERSATCTIGSPPMQGVVKDIDVRVELSAPSDATCADRGTRVTGTCVLPATTTTETTGRYPSGHSRLAPRASIVVRVNGDEKGRLQTDATGFPEPAEQCWTVQMP